MAPIRTLAFAMAVGVGAIALAACSGSSGSPKPTCGLTKTTIANPAMSHMTSALADGPGGTTRIRTAATSTSFLDTIWAAGDPAKRGYLFSTMVGEDHSDTVIGHTGASGRSRWALKGSDVSGVEPNQGFVTAETTGKIAIINSATGKVLACEDQDTEANTGTDITTVSAADVHPGGYLRTQVHDDTDPTGTDSLDLTTSTVTPAENPTGVRHTTVKTGLDSGRWGLTQATAEHNGFGVFALDDLNSTPDPSDSPLVRNEFGGATQSTADYTKTLAFAGAVLEPGPTHLARVTVRRPVANAIPHHPWVGVLARGVAGPGITIVQDQYGGTLDTTGGIAALDPSGRKLWHATGGAQEIVVTDDGVLLVFQGKKALTLQQRSLSTGTVTGQATLPIAHTFDPAAFMRPPAVQQHGVWILVEEDDIVYASTTSGKLDAVAHLTTGTADAYITHLEPSFASTNLTIALGTFAAKKTAVLTAP